MYHMHCTVCIIHIVLYMYHTKRKAAELELTPESSQRVVFSGRAHLPLPTSWCKYPAWWPGLKPSSALVSFTTSYLGSGSNEWSAARWSVTFGLSHGKTHEYAWVCSRMFEDMGCSSILESRWMHSGRECSFQDSHWWACSRLGWVRHVIIILMAG